MSPRDDDSTAFDLQGPLQGPLQCPLPDPHSERIILAHGGGGRLTQRLLDDVFVPAFSNPALEQRHDGALLDLGDPARLPRLAMTTDSFVVHPLEFPGGDIGTLAICGTVNDLAMCGARPVALSAGFILEEGLEIATLRRLVGSMAAMAARVGVPIVTGDTKVVDRGKGDQVFVNTTGVGVVVAPAPVTPDQVRPGDALVLSGDVGRHGVTILATREGLAFEAELESDCAPLVEPVLALFEAGVRVRCLRDLTRGGLATSLVEIAESSGTRVAIVERRVPVVAAVRGASEILGLDPLYIANEGRFLAIVHPDDAARAVEVLGRFEDCPGAAVIGTVEGVEAGGLVTLESAIGARRILDRLSGEQLPRIC